MNDLDFEEVMMLPYEAYTDKLDPNYLDDLIQSQVVYLLLNSYTSFDIAGKKEISLEYFSPSQKTTNKVCKDRLLIHQAQSCLTSDIKPALLQRLMLSGNPAPKKPSI